MSLVREFHEAFEQPLPPVPPLRTDPELVRFRARLIREEFEEVMAEFAALARAETCDATLGILRKLLKELADLRYVTDGAAVTFGLDIDGAVTRVHASNMSKLGVDGKPVKRADGKVLKGPNYFEPDLSDLVPGWVDATAET